MKWRLASVAAACVALTACQATAPQRGGEQWGAPPAPNRDFLSATASTNPCTDSERQKEGMSKSIAGGLIGAVGGAFAGAVLDRMVGNKNNQLLKVGMVAGMVAGAMKGYNNGVDSARRQCEVYKAAQARNAEIALATIRQGSETVGEVYVSPSRAFFFPGSDRLTPAGIEYFKEQGRQYTTEVQLAGYEATVRDSARRDQRTADLANYRVDSSQRAQVVQRWQNMRIMLTGHVDDRSGGRDPVGLSERRARAVGEVFRQAGVPPESIYFQGAGSSLPIADNNSEAGRDRNNRVEIAVFYDERQLAPYQEQRETDHRLFSSAETRPLPQATPRAPAPSPQVQAPARPAQPIAAAPAPQVAAPSQQTPVTASRTPAPVGIEFGGTTLSAEAMDVSSAIGPIHSDGGSILKALGIGNAIAATNLSAPTCVSDDANRYRKAAAKRLSDGKELAGRPPLGTSDAYLNLVRRSYAGPAGDHYVEVKNVSVFKSGELAETPTFNVFKGFQAKSQEEKRKTGAPEIEKQPVAVAVRGEKGLLIRQFFDDSREGLVCMDVVLPNSQAATATQKTALVYESNGIRKVANPTLAFQK